MLAGNVKINGVDPEEIVRALAELDVPLIGMDEFIDTCALCHKDVGRFFSSSDEEHAADCPWWMAREYMTVKEAADGGGKPT